MYIYIYGYEGVSSMGGQNARRTIYIYVINISLTSHKIREIYGKHIWEKSACWSFLTFFKVWRMGWRDLKQLKIRSTLSYLPVQHCWQWVKSNMFNTGTIIHFHQESSIQKKCLPEVSTVIVRWFRSVLQMGRSLRLLDSWTSYDTLIPSGNFFRLAMDKNRYVITNITNHQQKYGFPWFPMVSIHNYGT